jgi:hypothetical protein
MKKKVAKNQPLKKVTERLLLLNAAIELARTGRADPKEIRQFLALKETEDGESGESDDRNKLAS